MGPESNAFWEILVIMAVIAVISFQFPKKDFFLCFTTYKHYAIQFAFFSLHLINFKGIIGVPVAMAAIFFFVLEHPWCHKNF